MKEELIRTLQVAYALALAEAKTAQTAAEGIRQVLRDAHGFTEAGADVEKLAAEETDHAAREAQIREPIRGPRLEAAQKSARKAAKAARKPTAVVTAASKVIAAQRECPHCHVTYQPKRKDQTNCLSDACRKAAAVSWKNNYKGSPHLGPKAPRPAATAETGIEPAGSPSRLERIKALAGGGEVAP